MYKLENRRKYLTSVSNSDEHCKCIKKSSEESCLPWSVICEFEAKSNFLTKGGQIYFDKYKQNDIFCQAHSKKRSFRHLVVSLRPKFLVQKMSKEFSFTGHIC